MNDLQQKAIENLIIKNNGYIKELKELELRIEKEYSKYDKFKEEFWDLMNKMERSHSQIPFLPYVNLYCINNKGFSIPTMPCITDNLYGSINEEYKMITEEFINEMEKDMSQKAKKLSELLSITVKKMSELLDRILASNSITRRLSGLEEMSQKLEEKKDIFWYPKEMSKREYSMKGSYVVPLKIVSPTMVLPLHRRFIIQYEYLFKSQILHTQILNDTKAILNYINEYLPFAELVPLKTNECIKIENIVTPKQVQIGSENDFHGNINIGNEGELSDGNYDR